METSLDIHAVAVAREAPSVGGSQHCQRGGGLILEPWGNAQRSIARLTDVSQGGNKGGEPLMPVGAQPPPHRLAHPRVKGWA